MTHFKEFYFQVNHWTEKFLNGLPKDVLLIYYDYQFADQKEKKEKNGDLKPEAISEAATKYYRSFWVVRRTYTYCSVFESLNNLPSQPVEVLGSNLFLHPYRA